MSTPKIHPAVTEHMRALQAASAKSRWAKLTPAKRKAAMRRVRAAGRRKR